MKWRKFDKKVNDELVHHQSEVDIDALWAAIEPDVDAINAEKKKRRRGVFWWFFAGILLVGVGLGTLFFSGNKEETVAGLNAKKAVSESADVANFNNKETEIITNKKIADKEKVMSESAANSDKNSETNERLAIQNKAINQSTFSKSQTKGKKPADGKQPLAYGQTKSTNSDLSEKGSSDNIENEVEVENEVENNTAIDISSQEIATNLLENSAENDLENQTTNSAILNKESENSSIELPVDSSGNLAVSEADLQKNNKNETEEKAVENEAEIALEKEAEAENNKNRKSIHTAISIYGGAGFANRDLQAKIDSLDNNLEQLRGSTESNLETVQLGLQLHLQHEKTGLELTTGLNYTQINERFDYNRAVIEIDSIEGVEFVFRNVNGDTVETIGMLPRTTTTTFTNRHYNKYQLIDVPVLVGYQKEFGKFSVGAQAGVFINLRLKTSGKMLQSDTEIVDFSDANIYKSSVGLSYYFGATFGYELTDKWSISASPFVRHLPNNFAKENYSLEQKYTLFGLNVGLCYQF